MASPNNLIDSSFTGILKDLQEGTMISQLAEHSDMWKFVTTKLDSSVAVGQRLERSLKVARGIAAVGNIGYNGSFKSTKTASYTKLVAEPKYITAHIQVPRSVVLASKNDKGAFTEAMGAEIQDKQEGTAVMLSRQLFGDGSGILATIASAAGTTTGVFTLYRDSGKEGHVRWIELDDELVPYTSAGDDGAVSNSNSITYYKVTAIDESANTCTVQGYTAADATANFTAGDFSDLNVLIRKGITFNDNAAVTNHNDVSEELTGLEVIIDEDGTVFGVNRSTYQAYASHTKSGGNGLLTTSMFRDMLTGTKKKGGKPSSAIMSDDTLNRFNDIADEDNRFINFKSKVLGSDVTGFRASWGNVEFIADFYSRDDRIFAITPKYLELYGSDFSFVEDPDSKSVLRLATSSSGGYTPDYSAELLGTAEFFGTKPSAHGRLENFTNS